MDKGNKFDLNNEAELLLYEKHCEELIPWWNGFVDWIKDDNSADVVRIYAPLLAELNIMASKMKPHKNLAIGRDNIMFGLGYYLGLKDGKKKGD
jgi:hypothetical protein